jgi:putative transposase
MRLRELALDRPRYGYRRLTILLRREGWHVNAKRVYRLYREEGITVRVKRRKKLASHARARPPAAARVNDRWSMDFVADSLSNGGKIRVLTLIDSFTRECLALKIARECLNSKWFESLDDARQTLQAWRWDYNEVRPHSSLGDMPPSAFAAQIQGVAPAVCSQT